MNINGHVLASIPFLPPCYLLVQILLEHSPLQVVASWVQSFVQTHVKVGNADSSSFQMLDADGAVVVGPQLLAYVLVAIFGFWATDCLIPVIKVKLSFIFLNTNTSAKGTRNIAVSYF
jgi:hypothetical protein